ncbi:MAG: deacetylase [Bacteroidetes bacterium SW_9_63_38]|nr:MAG: deacetylase [Bacteroidetes bacterium SW_9_63_38]
MNRVNLFIIGINKAGTNWLNNFLAQHPDVFMSDVKEFNFFNNRESGTETLDEYHRYFPFSDGYDYYGEASAHYYEDEAVASRIHAYNPSAKLLAVVRDPIDRLRSQYRYHKQLGVIDEDTTLEEALTEKDPALLRDSHYERTLPVFADRFGPDQFQVVSLERGLRNPEAEWKRLLDYLSLSRAPCPDEDSLPKNPTGSASFRQLYRMTIRPIRRHTPSLYRWMLQSLIVQQAKSGLLRLLGTAKKTSISSSLRAELCAEFAPTYEYLYDLGFDVYESE